MADCFFCTVERNRPWIEAQDALAVAASDPITDGHTLIAPRKHVATIYELSMPEQQVLWALVGEVRARLLTGLKPDSFSIGFTDSLHEGDTSAHAAVHVVPRRRGELLELPDGIEWVTDEHLLAWNR